MGMGFWRETGAGWGAEPPEVVGELPPAVVAEVAARYGAVVARDVRAVRVSAGVTPPERIGEMPYGYYGPHGARMIAARKKAEAAALAGGEAAPPGPAPKARKLVGAAARAQADSVNAERGPRVAACLARGLTYREAAAELGLTAYQIEDTRKWLGRHPEMMPPNPRQIRGARLRAEALALLRAGKTPAQIASALGLPGTHSVYPYLPVDWRVIREGAACAPS